MSVRHQMRQRVEKLFKLMIENGSFPKDEETTVYVVFTPEGTDFEEESIEVSEQDLDLEDRESLKKFLDRTTREALEAEVKGLKLYGYVFESEGNLELITDMSKEPGDKIMSRIERMREDL